MKFIKPYNTFSQKINEEIDIDIDSAAGQKMVDEISDIFVHVRDCGLEVADVYTGHALSMGDREIVDDHRDFETILGSDGRYIGSYKSLSIRLRTVKGVNQNERPFFYIEEGLFDELESAISHIESQFDLELGSIYLRTSNGVWFNSVRRMRQYIDQLPFAKKESLKWVTYIDLTFKDLSEDVDDSVSVKESKLEEDNSEIILELEDILQDLKDEYFDIQIVDRSKRNNYCILVGFLKDTTGGLAEEFKLSEIKQHFERVLEFMIQNGFEIDDIDAFNLSQSVQVSPDPNKWNLDTKVLGINFYFD